MIAAAAMTRIMDQRRAGRTGRRGCTFFAGGLLRPTALSMRRAPRASIVEQRAGRHTDRLSGRRRQWLRELRRIFLRPAAEIALDLAAEERPVRGLGIVAGAVVR